MSFIEPIIPEGDWGITSPNAVPMYEDDEDAD